MKVLEIRKLHLSYGKKKVLEDFHLDLEAGRMLGILGPNGCGKSTLIRAILGYLKAEKGEISLFGRKDYSRKERAKLMAFVPQKSALQAPLSVEDFVLMGRLPQLESPWKGYTKKDVEQSLSYLKDLDLLDFRQRSALSLSGGEFQRLLLARALNQEAKLLLLDEATAALDSQHALDLMERIRAALDKGLTVLAVLHDLNLAALFCDEIVFISKGRVFAKGKPEEVLTEENLKEVYGLDAEITKTSQGYPYVILKRKKERRE